MNIEKIDSLKLANSIPSENDKTNMIAKLVCETADLQKENQRLNNIIKEVREYIETKYDYLLGDDTFLDHDERIDRKQIKHILGILGSDKEWQ